MQLQANARVSEDDRRLLVIPAPKDFHPVDGKEPVQLVLIVERSHIRVGEPIRYRLELMNRGRVPYAFGELPPSFFKTGRLPCDRIRLILRDASGHESDIYSPLKAGTPDIGVDEVHFPAGWTKAQKEEWMATQNRESEASSRLSVRLMPGERLRTAGDGPGADFRLLKMRRPFKDAGVYTIRAELDTLLGDKGIVSRPVSIEVSR